MSSPGVGPELWLHSPSHRVGRELIDFPLGARRAQSTLNPQVDTLAQRDRMEEQQTLGRKKLEELGKGWGWEGDTEGSLALNAASCPLDLATPLSPTRLLC